MKINVRKNNTNKAMSMLNRGMTADGDLKRYIERANGYMSKGQKLRRAKSAAMMRHRKELQERIGGDHEGN